MLNQLSTTISLFFLMLTGVLILAGCGASNPDKTVAVANERAVKVVSSSMATSPISKPTVLAVNNESPVKVMKAGLKTSPSAAHGSCSVDSCALPPALQKRMMMLKKQQEQATL